MNVPRHTGCRSGLLPLSFFSMQSLINLQRLRNTERSFSTCLDPAGRGWQGGRLVHDRGLLHSCCSREMQAVWAFPRKTGLWLHKITPRWFSHGNTNSVLDSDIVLLHVEVKCANVVIHCLSCTINLLKIIFFGYTLIC
jgi:hypothetical protein